MRDCLAPSRCGRGPEHHDESIAHLAHVSQQLSRTAPGEQALKRPTLYQPLREHVQEWLSEQFKSRVGSAPRTTELYQIGLPIRIHLTVLIVPAIMVSVRARV